MYLLGIVLIVLGLLAIGAPGLAGISLTLLLGMVTLAGGVAQTAAALPSRSRHGLGPLVWGIVTILAGVFIVTRPVGAMAGLTLFLAAYFLVQGISEVILALQVRPERGWGWALFSGAVSVLLALMIWRQFPLSGRWALGTLLGIKLLFTGWTIVSLRATLGSVAKAVDEATLT